MSSQREHCDVWREEHESYLLKLPTPMWCVEP